MMFSVAALDAARKCLPNQTLKRFPVAEEAALLAKSSELVNSSHSIGP
jgi:hypothetical protein